jgi:hypothetical protein
MKAQNKRILKDLRTLQKSMLIFWRKGQKYYTYSSLDLQRELCLQVDIKSNEFSLITLILIDNKAIGVIRVNTINW